MGILSGSHIFFDDMYEHACTVVDGMIVDDTFLPTLYELDSHHEWTDPAVWLIAILSLGAIKKTDDLRIEVERAKQNTTDLPGALCKEFNIRETMKTRCAIYSPQKHCLCPCRC